MKRIRKIGLFLLFSSMLIGQELELSTEQQFSRQNPLIKPNQNIQQIFQMSSPLHNQITDFQVNENVGRCEHYLPRIAVNMYGSFVTVWYESRDGKNAIFCQRYDQSGNPVGANFKVSEVTGSTGCTYPDVAVNADGNFVVVWQDHSSQDIDIYMQRFDSNGERIGSNTKVNDDTDNSFQQHPKVTLANNGRITVVWMDLRNSNEQGSDADIYLQRFDNDGDPIGANLRVNDDAVLFQQYFPEIYTGPGGEMAITWEDRRNGNRDIYFQRYNNIGSPVGVNIKVNDDAGTKDQFDPAVTIDGYGKITICWEDNRNTSNEIYFQRFDQNGNKLGSNVKVNDQSGGIGCYNPGIMAHGNGNFVVVWYDRRQGNRNIYAQRFDGNGTPIQSNFMVNEDTHSEHYLPQVDIDDAENFTIIWYDIRFGTRDIFYQRYDMNGNASGNNVMVNDDEGSSAQECPAIAVNPDGQFIITWQDSRNVIYDIYAQKYAPAQQPDGRNFLINLTELQGNRNNPVVALNDNGDFVVCWNTYLIGGVDSGNIYCQRFDRSGNPIGELIRVDDDQLGRWQFRPRMAMDSQGNFVVVWTDLRNFNFDAYFQRFDYNGNALGSNTMLIPDNPHSYLQGSPVVAMDGSGNFVFAWIDDRYETDTRDIMLQRFQQDGAPVGDNIKVNDDTGKNQQNFPQIAADSAGNFIVAWEDNRNGNFDIYCQFFNSDGDPISNNLKVNDDSGIANQMNVGVTMDKAGNVLIIWQDSRDGGAAIFGQRYYDNGRQKGFNFDTEILCQHTPVVKLMQGTLYYAYDDTRTPGHSFDIFTCVDQFNNAPDAPVLLSPENNYYTTITSPTLTFTVPDDADAGDSLHFIVEVATDDQFAQPISGSPFESQKNSSGFQPELPLFAGDGECSYIFTNAFGEGIYYWRVAAADRWDYGPASQSRCFKIDLNPPIAMGHSPQKYAQNVPVNSNISVALKDAVSGVDVTSIVMKVNDEIVTPSITGYDTSCVVVYDPPSDFAYNKTITVSFDAKDNAGHSMATDSYYFFSQADLIPPFTADHVPAKYARDVPINTDIALHIKDNLSGVDSAGIVLKVNGSLVNFSVTGAPQDFTVLYLPTIAFNYDETVNIMVDARDIAGNQMNTESYSFIIGSDPNVAPAAPALTSPADNSTLSNNKPALIWKVPTDENGDSLHFRVEIATTIDFSRHIFGSPFESWCDTTGFSPTPAVAQGVGECRFIPPFLLEAGDYWWRISARDGRVFSDVSAVRKFTISELDIKDQNLQHPDEYALYPNYPNPFNPTTTIKFSVKQQSRVSLKVYDISGTEIKSLVEDTYSPGEHQVQFNGEDLPSGIYIYIIKMDGFQKACKMTILK